MPRYHKGCSKCGALFTRKFNAERHVRNVHAGNAQVVITDKPVIGAKRSNTVLTPANPSYSGGSVISGFHSRDNNISEIINRRCRKIVHDKLSAYKSRRAADPLEIDLPLGFAGYVCNTCLNIDILDLYPESIRNVPHACYDLAILDHRQIMDNRRPVVDYLHRRLPAYMAEFIEGLIPSRIRLTAWPMEYCLEPPVRVDAYPVDHWSKKLLWENKTVALNNDTELMEFLRLTRNKTFGYFAISMNRTVRQLLVSIDFM